MEDYGIASGGDRERRQRGSRSRTHPSLGPVQLECPHYRKTQFVERFSIRASQGRPGRNLVRGFVEHWEQWGKHQRILPVGHQSPPNRRATEDTAAVARVVLSRVGGYLARRAVERLTGRSSGVSFRQSLRLQS